MSVAYSIHILIESGGSDKSDGQLEGNEQQNLSTFTLEQERKYARRFTEGFDLSDEQYEAWLRVNYPEQFRQGND